MRHHDSNNTHSVGLKEHCDFFSRHKTVVIRKLTFETDVILSACAYEDTNAIHKVGIDT